MAEAPAPSLGDFFKAKAKKKVKASNLNNATTAAKPEEKKNKKNAEDDAWEEEQIVPATIKGVESAGTLKKEEETKEDADNAAPAWGPLKTSKEGGDKSLNDKRFPTLQKAVATTSIQLEQEENKINIGTSKNMFATLEGAEDSDEENTKRPKSIKPAMVSKKKGEREKEAVEREVKKFKDSKKKEKKDKAEEDGEEEEDSDEEEEEGEEEAKEEAKDEARKKKLLEKKEKPKDDKEAKKAEPEEELEEDVKMVCDTAASKAKYESRRKLPEKEIPREDLEAEKENRPSAQVAGKKKKFVVDDFEEKKLTYMPDDW